MTWAKPTTNTSARGYGTHHQAMRRRYAADIAAGRGYCWRCGHPIPAGTKWHLGHDDWDRSRYRGPEHVQCNLSAAARKANLLAHANRAARSRRW